MNAGTRTYRTGCRLDYYVSEESTFILNIAVSRSPSQQVEAERLLISSSIEASEYLAERTSTRYHRFVAPPGTLTVRYDATVTCASHHTNPPDITADRIDELPFEVMTYLYPSRYCQSDLLMRLAQMEFGSLPSGYAKVQAICEWIRRNVEYLAGTTGPLTSAFDTATQRAGVCRDFAHLAIAFCRASNIPARFVSGYAFGLEPPDFHAMFEAWIGDRWYLFDPTGQISPGDLLRIGSGRDAADVSFAFIFGPSFMTEMSVYCETRGNVTARNGRRAADRDDANETSPAVPGPDDS